MNRHVEVPEDEVAFLECVGLMYDTDIILEDKLKVVPSLRTSLYKIDRYFYEAILCLLQSKIGCIPFKWT